MAQVFSDHSWFLWGRGGPLDGQSLCCLQGIPKAPPRMSELEERRAEETEARVSPGPAVGQGQLRSPESRSNRRASSLRSSRIVKRSLFPRHLPRTRCSVRPQTAAVNQTPLPLPAPFPRPPQQRQDPPSWRSPLCCGGSRSGPQADAERNVVLQAWLRVLLCAHPTLTPKELAAQTTGLAFTRVSGSLWASLVITQPLGWRNHIASSGWCSGLALPSSGLTSS